MLNDSRGFTLIEMLATLALLGVLASMLVPVAQIVHQRGREQELRLALCEIRTALDAYKQAADEGRIAHAPGASGYPPSLEILVAGVQDQRDPQRRMLFFLRRLPRDPMLPSAIDERAETSNRPLWGLRSYASPADAPRAGTDVYDIYSTSNQIGLNGLAYAAW